MYKHSRSKINENLTYVLDKVGNIDTWETSPDDVAKLIDDAQIFIDVVLCDLKETSCEGSRSDKRLVYAHTRAWIV